MTLQQHEHETEEPEELKLKGAMLVKVRGMTPQERLGEGWHNHPEDIPAVEYDNGAVLYAACERCDKPGTFYGTYEGLRWGIDSTGEPYKRPPTRKAPKCNTVQLRSHSCSLGLCLELDG